MFFTAWFFTKHPSHFLKDSQFPSPSGDIRLPGYPGMYNPPEVKSVLIDVSPNREPGFSRCRAIIPDIPDVIRSARKND